MIVMTSLSHFNEFFASEMTLVGYYGVALAVWDGACFDGNVPIAFFYGLIS
jgi:hypothetical protein